MTPSLGEIEAMAKRAARGAGLAWGMAEEAGKATRWLAARDLPGPEALAAMLAAVDGLPNAELAPRCTGRDWQAAGQAICPLSAGAALSDRTAALGWEAPLTLGPMICPVLMLPAVAAAAAEAGEALCLSWTGAALTVAAGGCRTETGTEALTDTAPCQVSVARAEAGALPTSDGPAIRPEVADAVWAELTLLAARTYAPATDASRLAGAGAGLNDND